MWIIRLSPILISDCEPMVMQRCKMKKAVTFSQHPSHLKILLYEKQVTFNHNLELDNESAFSLPYAFADDNVNLIPTNILF